jgi:ankyrin repeat protein
MAEGGLLRSLTGGVADEDEGVWDSMAVMASEQWNEGNADELGSLTRELLLPHGLSNLTLIEAKDKFLTAAQTGLLDVVKELHVSYGDCLLCHGDEDGYTALHRASYNGHLDVVEYLISCNANVHARTTDGWEPLHSACRWNKFKVASLLMQNDADINSVTNGYQTPLHLAACNNKAKNTLELLLTRDDIDVSIRNGKGETAAELAASYGRLNYLFEMKEKSIHFQL